MSFTALTKQYARSSSNVELRDHPEIYDNKKATDRRNKTTVSLGKVAWDQIFLKDSLNMPTTKFMEKLKQTIKEEDYHHINQEILKGLGNKRISSAPAIRAP